MMSSTEEVPDVKGFEESSEISGWLSTEVSPLPPTPGRLDTLDMTLSDAALRGLLSGFSLSEKKFELSLASSSLLSFLGAACILPRAFEGTLAADIIPVSWLKADALLCRGFLVRLWGTKGLLPEGPLWMGTKLFGWVLVTILSFESFPPPNIDRNLGAGNIENRPLFFAC